MKVLILGDLHIGVQQYGVLGDDGRNSRLVDVESVIRRVIDYANENEIELLIQCGDIFHTNRPNIDEQLVFYRIVQDLQQSKFQTRFIIGNHDFCSRHGDKHALALFQEFLGDYDKIRIYDKTRWELFAPTIAEKFLVCFYPFGGEAPDWKLITQHGNVTATAVVCHSHLEGAVVGAEPFEIKNDAATKFRDLPVDFVFAGHFHKPQILSESKPLAFYAGSIHSVDFNERIDTKGVVVVDTITKTYECVGFLTRKLLQFDLGSDLDLNAFLAAKLEVQNAIVKVNVTLDDANKFDEEVIRRKLVTCGAHSVASVNLNVVRSETKRDASIKLDISLADNFMKFINGRDYKELRKPVETEGKRIITQCP